MRPLRVSIQVARTCNRIEILHSILCALKAMPEQHHLAEAVDLIARTNAKAKNKTIFMSQSKYAHAAIQNMIKSPKDRWENASRLVEAAGGTPLQFHITYGEYGLFIIAHAPTAESSAPVLLAAASVGDVSDLTTVLAMTTSDGKAEFETARTVGNKFNPATDGT